MIEPAADVAIPVDHGLGTVVEHAHFPVLIEDVRPRSNHEPGMARRRGRAVLFHRQVIHRRAGEIGIEPAGHGERWDRDFRVALRSLIGNAAPIRVARHVAANPFLKPRRIERTANLVQLEVGQLHVVVQPPLARRKSAVAAGANDLPHAPGHVSRPVQHHTHEHAVLVRHVVKLIGRRDFGHDRAQRRRALRGGPPLRPTHVRQAHHADFAIAPRLRCQPLDEVVAIRLVLRIEWIPLAFRIETPARVRDRHHIAPLREPTAAGLITRIIAVRRDDQDRREPPVGLRLKNIHREPHSVPHRRLVPTRRFHLKLLSRVIPWIGCLTGCRLGGLKSGQWSQQEGD